jgi:hypothetical protein
MASSPRHPSNRSETFARRTAAGALLLLLALGCAGLLAGCGSPDDEATEEDETQAPDEG